MLDWLQSNSLANQLTNGELFVIVAMLMAVASLFTWCLVQASISALEQEISVLNDELGQAHLTLQRVANGPTIADYSDLDQRWADAIAADWKLQHPQLFAVEPVPLVVNGEIQPAYWGD